VKISFRAKLTLGFALVLILISGLTINFFYSRAHYVQRDNLRSRLIGIASTGALMIDGDLHETLQEPSDADTPAFRELRATLTRIKDANPGITYIYTMRRTGDPMIFQFVIDEAEEEDTNGNGVIGPGEESAGIGDPYDASTYPELRAAYEGPRADRRLQSDQWGTWLSGYAPIFNRALEVSGILGIDMAAEDVKAEESALFYTALVIFGLAAGVSVLAGALLARHFTRPIYELLGAIERIGRGDLKARINTPRRDEIGNLGRSFNWMAENLALSRREVEENNRLLEVKVRERTKELEAAQNAALQSKKMAAIGTLAGGVAHEFNNIFASIRTAAELALEEETGPAARRALEVGVRMSDRGAEITTALQAYTDLKAAGTAEPVFLRELAEQCLQPLAGDLDRLGIKVVRKLNEVEAFPGNRHQIQHALGSVLANARDAMAEEGGVLTVETGAERDAVFIRISDTGPGINPAIRETIFDPFSGDKGLLARGERGWTGLGLFSASGIIKRQGGRIEVESEPGVGASFTVFFPCGDRGQNAAPETAAPAQRPMTE
jgi:signal transduction histidine kinase